MNLNFVIPEFLKADEKLASIRQLAKYDPLIPLVRERFQQKITHHLTSLKALQENILPGNDPGYEELKQNYLGIGKEKAVMELLSDMAGQQLSTRSILLLAEILLQESQYRQKEKFIVNISGDRQNTPPAQEVASEMEKLVDWYNTTLKAHTLHPLTLASYLHYRLTTIHPFNDWNGRIARLLLNLALMKKGYLPVLIGSDERLPYYENLEQADKGNLEPLVTFIAQKELETIDDFMSSPEYLSIQGKFELEEKLKNMNRGEKCIVLTEDSVTNNLFSLILESSGFNLNETSVISYEGCSKISSANLFSIFVKQKMPGVKIIVHRDRDYLTDAEIEEQRQSFQRIDTHLFVTRGTDIESYFLNKKHIHYCCPGIELEQAGALLGEALEEVFPKSVDYLWKKEFGGHKSEGQSHLGKAVEELVRQNLLRFTHGKTAYKVLLYKIQDYSREQVNLEQPSPYLAVKELRRIAVAIWGE